MVASFGTASFDVRLGELRALCCLLSRPVCSPSLCNLQQIRS